MGGGGEGESGKSDGKRRAMHKDPVGLGDELCFGQGSRCLAERPGELGPGRPSGPRELCLGKDETAAARLPRAISLSDIFDGDRSADPADRRDEHDSREASP